MMMTSRSGALLLALTLLLAACGKQSSTDQVAPAATAEGGTAAPSAATAPPPKAALASDKAPAAPTTIKRINEDGSETVETTAADSGAHNAMLAAVASTAVAATTLSAPSLWQEGVNYTRLVPAQPTSVPPGQVEVLEFFWYACPHCYALDPLVESWKKTKPAYITFIRVPVMWNESHRSLARLFYTLESLGKLEALHTAIFKEIQVSNDPLVDPGNNDAATERIQTTFAKNQGISPEAFKTAYHSFAVETALQRADQLTQRYRVDGVPTFVVNGKFIADVATAQGEDRILPLVSDLAALEHRH
jgi:thiol:disulfide interchange protein DsbA